MIKRYLLAPMEQLWGDYAKWARVLKVEVAALEVLAEDGVVPTAAVEVIRRDAAFDIQKIDEYERITRHDVIAFLQSVGDSVGEQKRWLHYGLTSYDVVDTALSMALIEAGSLIKKELDELRAVLARQAVEHKETLMAGRTHGVHAEPITFGWKIAGWVSEVDRNLRRLDAAIDEVSVGKLSGAVGTYPTITPDQESRICRRLGLRPEPVATQVIPRDRHAFYLATLALIGGMVERIALEVRLLQHSEVEEVYEPFLVGQRGSSAMPHKKNPVTAENMCGLARLLRSYLSAALENIPLWHERDISHSSVERIALPDATSVVYYLLDRLIWMVANWDVNRAAMLYNVERDAGLMASGALLTALRRSSLGSDDLYRRVQQHALAAREGGATFIQRVKGDVEIVAALGAELEEIFNDAAVIGRSHIPLKRAKIIPDTD